MSYTHVLCNRGAVHAVPEEGGEWTVCGKEVTYRYDEVGDPITCKVCARSIELSRDFRISRRLSHLVAKLHHDMQQRPGAYTFADRETIVLMKITIESE